MEKSESTLELYKALLAARKEFTPVKKNTVNTFFKSKYATLDDILAMCEPVLLKHDLMLLQPLKTLENGKTVIETKIVHISGEWIGSTLNIPEMQQKGANLLQEFGIGVTYLRRYMLSSLLGISTEDDNDGNKPSADSNKPKVTEQEKASKEQVAKIKKLFVECYEQMKEDDEKLDEKINAALAKRRFNKLDALGKNEAVAVIKKLESVKNAE